MESLPVVQVAKDRHKVNVAAGLLLVGTSLKARGGAHYRYLTPGAGVCGAGSSATNSGRSDRHHALELPLAVAFCGRLDWVAFGSGEPVVRFAGDDDFSVPV